MGINEESPIVRMEFGSKLYGTSTPESDKDFKGIFIPNAEDILFGTIQNTTTSKNRKPDGQKNNSSDVDDDWYSLKKYLELLTSGQPVAMDMLFCPDSNILSINGPLWETIQQNKHRFLSRQVTAFLGYCRTQANKYGIKGSRVAAVRSVVNFLKKLPPEDFLGKHLELLQRELLPMEFVNVTMLPVAKNESQPRLIACLECCGRKMFSTVTVKYSLACYGSLLDSYGERAKLAEQNSGIDWKALSHAVRIYHQAKELLTTENITFPRPERELLLAIKQGKLPYSEVATIIENGLEELESLKEKSHLPEKADLRYLRQLVVDSYHAQVANVKRGNRMLSNWELREIGKRCDEATEGEWNTYGDGPFAINEENSYLDVVGDRGVRLWADANFICYAKSDIPKLLSHIEYLEENNDKVIEKYNIEVKHLTDRIEDLEEKK